MKVLFSFWMPFDSMSKEKILLILCGLFTESLAVNPKAHKVVIIYDQCCLSLCYELKHEWNCNF